MVKVVALEHYCLLPTLEEVEGVVLLERPLFPNFYALFVNINVLSVETTFPTVSQKTCIVPVLCTLVFP